MKRFIPSAGVALILLLPLASLLATSPAAAEAEGIALLRATQEPVDPGQAALNAACTTCHDLAGLAPGLHTSAELRETITRMVGYGAAVTEAQTEAIVAFLATDAAPAGGGVDAEAAQAVLNSACATCHDLAGVMPGVYTTAEWRETINRMIGYGASISADDTELIVQYLASDAAPGEAAEVDQAAAQALLDTACATCHDLTAVQPDLYTAAEWSEVIQRMIEYGAAVTADQTELILDYLATDR